MGNPSQWWKFLQTFQGEKKFPPFSGAKKCVSGEWFVEPPCLYSRDGRVNILRNQDFLKTIYLFYLVYAIGGEGRFQVRIVRMIGTHFWASTSADDKLKRHKEKGNQKETTKRLRWREDLWQIPRPRLKIGLMHFGKNPAYRSSSWAVASVGPPCLCDLSWGLDKLPSYKGEIWYTHDKDPYDQTSKVECDKGLEGCWVDMENYLSFHWVVCSCMHPILVQDFFSSNRNPAQFPQSWPII